MPLIPKGCEACRTQCGYLVQVSTGHFFTVQKTKFRTWRAWRGDEPVAGADTRRRTIELADEYARDRLSAPVENEACH